jgi:hypothetical protein
MQDIRPKTLDKLVAVGCWLFAPTTNNEQLTTKEPK